MQMHKECLFRLDFYADENKNLIFFPLSSNPKYNPEKEAELDRKWEEYVAEEKAKGINIQPLRPNRTPAMLAAKVALEVPYPYSEEDVLSACRQTIENTNKYPPSKKLFDDALQLYYGLKKYKEATCGKRMIGIFYYKDGSKDVLLRLPTKTGKWWNHVEDIELSSDSSQAELAKAIIHMAQADLMEAFPRAYSQRSRFNLLPWQKETKPKKR